MSQAIKPAAKGTPSVAPVAPLAPVSTSRNRPIADSAVHIPALDGIRGVAVLLVLVCHGTLIEPTGAFGKLFLASTRLSWTGVDLFFVLSGFLITGILFDSKGSDGYFRNFYARRTVRIFPLYYVFLFLSLVLIPMVPALMHHFGEPPPSGIFYWLYLSNYYQPFHHTKYMVHVSWSLAIEEQFYLCWPLIVFLFDRKTLLRLCGALFVASLVLRSCLLAMHFPWEVINDLTPCRLDGLAAGAWLALTIRGNSRRSMLQLKRPARVVAAIAAIAIAVVVALSYFAGSRGIGQSPAYLVAGYTLFALMYGSVLVLVVGAAPGGAVNRLFRSRLLTTFGKYSYAVYLLHLPVNILVANLLFDPSRPGKSNASLLLGQVLYYVVTFTLSLAVAWVSWNVLEKHCLKLKKYFPTTRRPPLDKSATTTAAAGATAGAAATSRPSPTGMPRAA